MLGEESRIEGRESDMKWFDHIQSRSSSTYCPYISFPWPFLFRSLLVSLPLADFFSLHHGEFFLFTSRACVVSRLRFSSIAFDPGV